MIERKDDPPMAVPSWVTSGTFRLVCDGEDEFEDRIEPTYRDLDDLYDRVREEYRYGGFTGIHPDSSRNPNGRSANPDSPPGRLNVEDCVNAIRRGHIRPPPSEDFARPEKPS